MVEPHLWGTSAYNLNSDACPPVALTVQDQMSLLPYTRFLPGSVKMSFKSNFKLNNYTFLNEAGTSQRCAQYKNIKNCPSIGFPEADLRFVLCASVSGSGERYSTQTPPGRKGCGLSHNTDLSEAKGLFTTRGTLIQMV